MKLKDVPAALAEVELTEVAESLTRALWNVLAAFALTLCILLMLRWLLIRFGKKTEA